MRKFLNSSSLVSLTFRPEASSIMSWNGGARISTAMRKDTMAVEMAARLADSRYLYRSDRSFRKAPMAVENSTSSAPTVATIKLRGMNTSMRLK